jgi:iron(III) transport system permease protein
MPCLVIAMIKVKPEMRIIFYAAVGLFLIFLVLPLMVLLMKSLESGQGFTFSTYLDALSNKDILTAIGNSFKVSAVTALITTVLAFVMAYSINATRIHPTFKGVLKTGILLPMLLPTITYGFAIMYSFGNQGLFSKLFGSPLFNMYGFNGLLIGYVIYTLPPAFLVIHNSFQYIDKKFIIVSKLMGDSTLRSFMNTIIRPLWGTLGGAFVLSFILSFTDFGIPASIGGTYTVVATLLYQVMLGAIPDFNQGAVIAVLMLLPAVLGILLLHYLEKLNFHYDKVTDTELMRNRWRDTVLGSLSFLILSGMVATFAIMFIAPFLKQYPFNNTFTLEHIIDTFSSNDLTGVYKNSLYVSVLTAILGTIVAYGAALINGRTAVKGKSVMDWIAMVTNTVPGMVLGLSYLLLFNGTSFKGTFAILIFCNLIHFFTTPYLMAKHSLSKMNPGWETTGELLGDSWFKTVRRVIIPNSATTILEMAGYYFINSMVTISGIIFLITAETSLVSSKIQQLQHFAKFNEIFVLSLLIFGTNLIVKLLLGFWQKRASLQTF